MNPAQGSQSLSYQPGSTTANPVCIGKGVAFKLESSSSQIVVTVTELYRRRRSQSSALGAGVVADQECKPISYYDLPEYGNPGACLSKRKDETTWETDDDCCVDFEYEAGRCAEGFVYSQGPLGCGPAIQCPTCYGTVCTKKPVHGLSESGCRCADEWINTARGISSSCG